MKTETARRLIAARMLPHTCIGHPIAAGLSATGLSAAATAVHHYSLPVRVRRRLERRGAARADFNTSDRRLFTLDAFWLPLASLLRVLISYDAAAFVFSRWGPLEVAHETGACSYTPPTPAERKTEELRKRKRKAEEAEVAKGYRALISSKGPRPLRKGDKITAVIKYSTGLTQVNTPTRAYDVPYAQKLIVRDFDFFGMRVLRIGWGDYIYGPGDILRWWPGWGPEPVGGEGA